ncbi:PAS domain-containing protein [bacterium]|nr:PAS domain-containing protein [bacterium]
MITFVNDAMEKVFGCDLKHMLGGTPDEIFEDKTAKNLLDIRRRFRRHLTPQTFRMRGRLGLDAGCSALFRRAVPRRLTD